ncbi:ankyrin repeat and LEM domain-containing protein 1 isoform X2 [Canis lupus baileyi]|uniref:ankyrin repeat and LEM domain-containing protein 1 isoform X2 n=1 Tax=Canis lupus baileyi TaxID=143281 RepID=UPI003B978E99
MHLAAGARHPRGLRCLEALLRRGGDANARSVEALTPLHVAAAWGCRRGLELLLGHGADPALRDQQGHRDCVHVLREFQRQRRTRTSTPTGVEREEPEPEPDGPDPWGKGLDTSRSAPPCVTPGSTAVGRSDGRDMCLEASPRLSSLRLSSLRLLDSLLVQPEIADSDSGLESPPGQWDCSSDTSFVTAIEASGTEDPALDTASGAGSLPRAEQGLLPDIQSSQRMPRSPGTPQPVHRAAMADREAELNTRLRSLTLTSSDASPTPVSVPVGSPAQSPPLEPLPGLPDSPSLKDEEVSLDSDVAALWLTEDEVSSTGDRDSVPSCWCPLVPAMSDLELLRGLQALGESLGPITPFTRPYHLRRLEEAHQEAAPDFSGHSPELAEALRTGCIPDAQADEDMLTQQFERPDPKRRWREGLIKSSFTYLLMDPRETQDLPARAFSLTQAECLRAFVRAIFYVGKGTRARPDFHLREALRLHRRPGKQACPKVRQILEIWASGRGVVSLHCFQHVIAVEAYTREACLVEALGIQMLTNQKQGHYYGVVANWPATRRRRLGVHLLHRALLVFLAEGERELRPQDIQARG